MGFDSGRSEQIIREAVLRQGILVRNCEGTEHCLKWKKKEDVSAEAVKNLVSLESESF